MGGVGKTIGVVFLVLIFLGAGLASAFAVSDEIENITINYSENTLNLSEIDKAIKIVMSHPIIRKLMSNNSWKVVAAIKVSDYNGTKLVLKSDKLVYVEDTFFRDTTKVWIAGWTCQLIVGVDLKNEKIRSIVPLEPTCEAIPKITDISKKMKNYSIILKILEAKKIVESHSMFKNIKDIDARIIWVAKYGSTVRAYFHVYKGADVMGVATVDLPTMRLIEQESGLILRIKAINRESESSVKAETSATQINPKRIDRYGDSFYNYDFDNRSLNSPPDWPVNLVFFKNADVNKAKNIYWGPTIFAYEKYMYLEDAGWEWDSDRGTKGIVGVEGKVCGIDLGNAFLHIRIYADSDDRMWNYKWNYYVLGTAHLDDWPEIPGFTPAGFNEEAEDIATALARIKGYIVHENYDYFDNAVSYCYNIGHKYYLNYGWADFIEIQIP